MKIKPSLELSEICGIHAGDGYLRGKDHRKELDISGNIEEKDYYDLHIKKLFRKVFGIDIQCKIFSSRNTYGFVIRDRKVIEFMHNLGFPYGNKSTIVKVPKFIINSKNKKYYCAFLRGLFDTDGCVYFVKRNSKENYQKYKKEHNYYPLIKFGTVSRNLDKDINTLLKKVGFGKNGRYVYHPKNKNYSTRYILTIYGVKKIKKFFKKIGSKNLVKASRFLIWKKFGFCPSKTSYSERLKMLKTTKYIMDS